MRTEEFNHIILPMRSNLKAYALRLTESDDNAEDLVQEVMLRLWDMRHDIKAEDNLKALAITIMRNKFYDQCRHEERNFTTDKVMEVPIEDRRVVHSDCGVVSLYRDWCTVAVGFSKGEGWHHGSHHHYVFDIHNTIFYVVFYSY